MSISDLRFARKSTHTSKSETGTATWEEFDGGLRVQHSEHEREYTPDVFDSFKVLDWDAETDTLGEELGEYRDVKMSSMSINVLFPCLVWDYFNSLILVRSSSLLVHL